MTSTDLLPEFERILSLSKDHEKYDSLLEILNEDNIQLLPLSPHIFYPIRDLLDHLKRKGLINNYSYINYYLSDQGKSKIEDGGFTKEYEEKNRQKKVDKSVIRANRVSIITAIVSSGVSIITLIVLLSQYSDKDKPTDVNIKEVPQVFAKSDTVIVHDTMVVRDTVMIEKVKSVDKKSSSLPSKSSAKKNK